MSSITVAGETAWSVTRARSPSGSPARFTKFENTHAPMSTVKSAAVVKAVSRSTSKVSRTVRVPRARATRNAPIAPMPAASVGENVRFNGHTSNAP